MKYNCWLILGAVLSTSLLAQQPASPTAPAPIATPAAAPAATLAPATPKKNAPAAKAVKKKAAPKKAPKAPAQKAAPKKAEALPELKTVPLVPGPATVVARNVNVRGQAKLKSEILTQVTEGQTVTVIEEIVRNNSGPQEPSAWAKIALPPKARSWVHRMFINATNQTVLPRRLNLRSGPGENYSVIGMLHRGDVVKELTTKGDWIEIEPPADAYAFMAAQFLKQEPPAPPAPPPAPPEPAPTPATVAVAPPVAPPPTEAPAVPPAPELPAVTPAPEMPETPEVEEVEEPPPPRFVQREGIVRGMTSIQAPSRFALISPENGRNIDYLYTTSEELDLRRYKGLRIVVTGEESLDERWGNTPVLTIQRIQVLEE
jgi:hypothetical protein